MKNQSTKKIVMLPLDERPCNFDYPTMMPNTGIKVVLPPKEYMGDKKIPANTDRLARWLLENGKDADACVISLDTLIYGGIVPSRLHHESVETLVGRASAVEKLRKLNPTAKIYVFQLIMRCPDYSLSEEEPDYYDECGLELHLYGRYSHLEKLNKLTEADKKEFERVKAAIKPEYLEDFLSRRNKNISVLMHDLELIKNGVVDYFIIPQDDAAVYGFTSLDQIRVREYLKENTLHLKTAMYPSADDTGLTLLARACNALSGKTPKVFVHYASSKADRVVPWFEDRMVGETIKYQIMAAGCRQVYSLAEADMLLAVNMSSNMYYPDQPEHVMAYDVERNLAELVAYMEYALEQKKVVAVGDVATANGGDPEFVKLLCSEGLAFKVHAYAGWNTSSNTLGTTICQGVMNVLGCDKKANDSFLIHRYFEDIGYMAYTRKVVTDEVLPPLGLDSFHTDGKDGKVAAAVRETMIKYMREEFPSIYARAGEIKVNQPWRRMFETDVKITLKD